MRVNTLRSVRTLCLAPMIAFGLASAAQAQVAKPAMPPASMPSAGMPKPVSDQVLPSPLHQKANRSGKIATIHAPAT